MILFSKKVKEYKDDDSTTRIFIHPLVMPLVAALVIFIVLI